MLCRKVLEMKLSVWRLAIMVRGGLETCYHGGRRKEGTNVLLMCRHNLPLNLFKRISFNTLWRFYKTIDVYYFKKLHD